MGRAECAQAHHKVSKNTSKLLMFVLCLNMVFFSTIIDCLFKYFVKFSFLVIC